MDRRYRETKGAPDTDHQSQRLIGRYLARAAQDNRRTKTMGGSTGGTDPIESSRRRGIVASMRGADQRESNEVFEASRDQVKRTAAGA